MEIDRADFLSAMRRAPAAVAILAAAAGERRSGLAVTAWSSVSADPPTLLACVNRQASAHALVLEAQAFSLNLLACGQGELVAVFSGQRGLDGSARFAPDLWREGPSGQPMLGGGAAAFACRLVAAHDHATHTVLVGQVEALEAGDADALVYLDGAFAEATRRASSSAA